MWGMMDYSRGNYFFEEKSLREREIKFFHVLHFNFNWKYFLNRKVGTLKAGYFKITKL